MPAVDGMVLGAGAVDVAVGVDAHAAKTAVHAQNAAMRIPEVETIIENPYQKVRKDSWCSRRAACRAFLSPVDSDSTTAHNLHCRLTSRFTSP